MLMVRLRSRILHKRVRGKKKVTHLRSYLLLMDNKVVLNFPTVIAALKVADGFTFTWIASFIHSICNRHPIFLFYLQQSSILLRVLIIRNMTNYQPFALKMS